MSLWLDEKFLRLLSPSLDHFVQKHPHVFNFRCPLCGDSEQNKHKARGYCFNKATTLIYKCHNCGVALPFSALLKRSSRRLFDEYMLEKLKEAPQPKTDEDVFSDTFANVTDGATTLCAPGPGSKLVPLSDPSTRTPGPLNPVYEYARKRRVPDEQMGRLWATIHAHTYLLPLVGEDKAAKVKDGEPYLVLPLTMTSSGHGWYGAQFRLLTRKEYITYKWSERETLKVFGLDKWIPAETTYIVEGPLDSLFVPNALAACSADLLGVAHIMEARNVMDPLDSRVFVWDSEPRNKEVVRLMRNAIRLGEQVVIWPKGFPKDINDAVLQGMTPEDVFALIRKRTHQGLRAELEFASWLR
jgi:predicted RNA-binding Zn-ribbon protein involved in translation (DUF1610 family)